MSFDLDFQRSFFCRTSNSLSVKTAAAANAWRPSLFVRVLPVALPPFKKERQSAQIDLSEVNPGQNGAVDLIACCLAHENPKQKALMNRDHENIALRRIDRKSTRLNSSH